jgi:hypothetical protein
LYFGDQLEIFDFVSRAFVAVKELLMRIQDYVEEMLLTNHSHSDQMTTHWDSFDLEMLYIAGLNLKVVEPY